MTLSNSSFSRQPRCAEGRPGSRHCSCDTGFQMRAGGVCQGTGGTRRDEARWGQVTPIHPLCTLQMSTSASFSSPAPRPGSASTTASTSRAPTAASAPQGTCSTLTATPARVRPRATSILCSLWHGASCTARRCGAGPVHPLFATTDVDECTGSQHNCTHGELCINTFGGHRCVRPKCPPPRHNTSYVKTSSL